jgi:hypothetical protein
VNEQLTAKKQSKCHLLKDDSSNPLRIGSRVKQGEIGSQVSLADKDVRAIVIDVVPRFTATNSEFLFVELLNLLDDAKDMFS